MTFEEFKASYGPILDSLVKNGAITIVSNENKDNTTYYSIKEFNAVQKAIPFIALFSSSALKEKPLLLAFEADEYTSKITYDLNLLKGTLRFNGNYTTHNVLRFSEDYPSLDNIHSTTPPNAEVQAHPDCKWKSSLLWSNSPVLTESQAKRRWRITTNPYVIANSEGTSVAGYPATELDPLEDFQLPHINNWAVYTKEDRDTLRQWFKEGRLYRLRDMDPFYHFQKPLLALPGVIKRTDPQTPSNIYDSAYINIPFDDASKLPVFWDVLLKEMPYLKPVILALNDPAVNTHVYSALALELLVKK